MAKRPYRSYKTTLYGTADGAGSNAQYFCGFSDFIAEPIRAAATGWNGWWYVLDDGIAQGGSSLFGLFGWLNATRIHSILEMHLFMDLEQEQRKYKFAVCVKKLKNSNVLIFIL